MLVGVLFVAGLGKIGFAQLIAILFVLTMLLLVVGLLLFLYEVRLATRALRVSRQRRMERLAEE